jgi:hypothetical protein
MKKILIALVLVTLISCNAKSGKNGSSTDSLSVVKSDSTVGTKVDSSKVDSTKK